MSPRKPKANNLMDAAESQMQQRTKLLPTVSLDDERPATENADTPDDSLAIGWWRWPLIPIAAPVAWIVSYAVIITMIRYSTSIMVGPDIELPFVPEIASSMASGYLCCFTSGYIAPRGKVITGVVMAIALATFSLYITILAFTYPERVSSHPFEVLLYSVFELVGSVGACVALAEQQDRG